MNGQAKDTQSTKYQLTINHPEEKGMTHKKITAILKKNFKTLEYFCMADEQGTVFHTHVFICFLSRVRFSTVKKQFPQAHIEAVKGTVSQNISYIRKTGRWEDTDKGGTAIEGSFEEYGNRPPDSRGKRNDMTELYQMVSEGKTNAEILAVNQDYILNIDKIDKVRTTVLTERYKNTFRDTLKVTDNAIIVLEKAKELNPDGEFVFMPYGRPMNTERFNIYLKKYCNAVGIPPRTSHKIRFYSASVAYNGKNLVTISKMMGHSQTATTMHYLRDVMQDDNLEETFRNLG